MNKWKGYLQYNGDGVSLYREVEFEIPEDIYADAAQDADFSA